MSRTGFTLIELMIVIAVIAEIAAIAIPGMLSSIRASNERNASSSLKSLATAQADFRSNDRDNHGIQDYWTGDVAGLFCIDNTSVPPATVASIKLIDVSVALADLEKKSGSTNYDTDVTAYGNQSAKASYWYRVLTTDNETGAAYAQDTDGTNGAVRNTSRFGYAAMPDACGSSGSKAFVMNEGMTIFKKDFGKDVLRAGLPPSLDLNVFAGNWPKSDELKTQGWSKLD